MLLTTLCKRCPKCRETKAVQEFYASSRGDGYSSKCRSCFQRYYQANREQRLAYQRAYNDRNREAIRARNREYMRRQYRRAVTI